MQLYFQSLALLITTTFAGSFILNSFPRRLCRSSSLLRGTDDQIINDLNLEEMFEVFEAAGILTLPYIYILSAVAYLN